jgi:hypothetical protein
MKNKNSKVRVILTPKSLRKHPYVQAAAVTLVANLLMHDIDGHGQDDDDTPQVAWEVVFKKVELSKDDPREGVVADAICELANDMRAALVKKGLLDKDCARKWQELRAA